jgi:quercetin dioxygenase-like cupin family protein
MNSITANEPTLSEPEVYGEIETTAQGLAYGAMVFTVKPSSATEPHDHASEETWIVQKGTGRAQIDGQSIGLIPGTRICVPPRALHHIANTSAADLQVMAFWWRGENE